jgi:hypothetical protein
MPCQQFTVVSGTVFEVMVIILCPSSNKRVGKDTWEGPEGPCGAALDE